LDGKRTTRFQVEETLSSLNIKPDGHNIIMQGDVTKIIKMTPMQRREIIDEVSGIAEYEAKKQESIRELSKVQEKTKEANIIMGERTGYLNVLEKEKIEAELYQKLNNERKQYSATLVKKELDSVEKSYTKLLDYLAKQNATISDITKDLGKYEEELKKADKEYEELNKKVFEESEKKQTGVRSELDKVRQDLADAEAKIRHSKELIDKNRAKREEILKNISEHGNKIKEKEKEIDAYIIKEEEIEIKSKQVKEELDELMKEAGRFDKNLGEAYRQLDKLGSEIEKRKEELHALDADIRAINERTELKKSAYQAKEAEIKSVLERENKLKETLKGFERDVAGIQKELGEKEERLKNLYDQEKTNNELFTKYSEDLLKAQKEVSSVESKITTLKSITGFSPAVEAVLSNKELKGILGTVADLCKYGKEHATAIETAAGTRLFYMITETADAATEAVKYLKNNQLGRATFIPLDKIRPVEISKNTEMALGDVGAVGLALKLITFDNRLFNAFSYVFGETVVVKNIDSAKNIGIGTTRMVTLDGDLCESSGIITGGYSKKGISLAELKALDELKQKATDLGVDKQNTLKRLEFLREEINRVYDERSQCELKLRGTEVTVTEWTNRLKEYADSVKQSETGISFIQKDLKELEDSLAKKDDSRRKMDEEIAGLLDKRKVMKDAFDKPEAKELNEKIKQKQFDIQNLKDQKSEFEIKIKTANGEIERVLIHNRKELEKLVTELDKENGAIDKEIETASNKRNDLIKLLKETEAKEREMASSVTGLFRQQETLNRKTREISEKIGEINRKADRVKEEMNEKNIDKTKLEIRYNELKREWQKYKDIPLLEESVVALTDKVNEVEKQLTNLGNVNLKAIDMYNRISKEVNDIREKSKKLEEERESIMNLIAEIEKKKMIAFTQTFNALNEYFKQYFKEFYPEEGSFAAMKLENQEEPLDSGLILEAKPLGKPLKSIDLLSGGEKSVVALAFLFAIQAYNPSPFYVLDEVDAALDRENSERVARMLKKFSKELQFIIITHNAAVTKNSDQIIGVHMSKDGSSLIEVDLKGYQTAEVVTK
jgi:chromosome segregation protein